MAIQTQNSVTNVITPEFADLARRVNFKLVELISKRFPYEWDCPDNYGTHYAPRERGGDDFSEQERIGRTWLDNAMAGKEHRHSIHVLRSLLPLLLAAEQINAPLVHVTTAIGLFPYLDALLNYFTVTVWSGRSAGEAENEEGSWAYEFMHTVFFTRQMYIVVFQEEDEMVDSDEPDPRNSVLPRDLVLPPNYVL